MKKSIRKIIVGLMVFTMMLAAIPTAVLPAQADNTMPKDLTGHWAEAAIDNWVSTGMGSGYPDGTFRPDKSVTRAEFATMANKAFGITPGGKAVFSDCKTTDWYYNDLAAAFNNGYISGYKGGSVKPVKAISRQEAAVMLAKLLKLSTDAKAHFTDNAQIPAWAIGSAAAVANAGAMKGYPDGSFRGSKAITRAEAVVALSLASGNTIPASTTSTSTSAITSAAAVSATAISITPSSINLTVGGITKTITATLKPSDATTTVTWSSSNTAVATVSAGVVTAVKAGTATITAAADGHTATCAVTVAAGTSSGGGGGGGGSSSSTSTVSVTATNTTVLVGSTTTETVTTNPASATITASSSNNGIATVSVSGHVLTITGVTAGTSTITVTGANSGYSNGTTTFTATVNPVTPQTVTVSNVSAEDRTSNVNWYRFTITGTYSTVQIETNNGIALGSSMTKAAFESAGYYQGMASPDGTIAIYVDGVKDYSGTPDVYSDIKTMTYATSAAIGYVLDVTYNSGFDASKATFTYTRNSNSTQEPFSAVTNEGANEYRYLAGDLVMGDSVGFYVNGVLAKTITINS